MFPSLDHLRRDFLKDWIHVLVQATISDAQTIHSRPPYTARLFGIWSVGCYVAYQRLERSLEGKLRQQDTIDGWKIGSRCPKYLNLLWNVAWWEATFAVLLQGIGQDYLPSLTVESLKTVYDRHLFQLEEFQRRLPLSSRDQRIVRSVKLLSPWGPVPPQNRQEQEFVKTHNIFREEWSRYLLQRQQDGWKQAQIVPTDMSNRDVRIPVHQKDVESKIDLNRFLPDPNVFALLEIFQDSGSSVRQQYLGASFGKIDIEAFYSQEERQVLEHLSQQYYPTEEQRKEEIHKMMSPPDDYGKVIAEFWAGSFPRYCNPPASMMWCATLIGTQRLSFESCVIMLIQMGLSLFPVATVCWDLKYHFMQPRPIQDIRRWYPHETIETWTQDEPTKGCHWLPYQEKKFVTPPFPDFPSGHSCFSSVFTFVLLKWFPDGCIAVSSGNISSEEWTWVTPLLRNPLCPDYNGCSWTIPQGCSMIDPGRSPSGPVKISLMNCTEWMDMIGESRVAGGIHTPHTNRFSQIVAEYVIQSIQKRFFNF